MYESKGDVWLKKHNIPDEAIEPFRGPGGLRKVKTIEDVKLLLAFGWEFEVGFRGKDYFITPCSDYAIMNYDTCFYDTEDLDDFGENARIGENGEFYLKDVIDVLEF